MGVAKRSVHERPGLPVRAMGVDQTASATVCVTRVTLHAGVGGGASLL